MRAPRAYYLMKNKIEEVDGWGTITSAASIDVALNDGSSRTITFDNLIIGTGATVRMLPACR